jgi:hypothetical protein
MSSREEGIVCEQSVDVAPYVLGALDPPDGFRAHLDGCATCRAEVAELQLVVDTLPATVPPVRVPRALRERVLATVRSEAELLRAAGHQMDERPKRVSRWRSRRGPFLTASVALAASVAVAAVIVLDNVGSTTPERVTVAQVAPSIPGGHASLRLLDSRAELVVSGMPQPALGKIYEVWLSRGSGSPQPTDALFNVTGSGSGSVNVPGNLHGVKEVMVTAEPLGGSSRPTSSPVLRVVLHA